MARGSSSAPLPATFAVFVDTSLDTHLAMVVSPDDTVGDLKGKIMIEHALCFPNIGQITVQSMKVRRRGSLYHLSDTMPVKSAFIGVKGTWFLYMDALSASQQAEPTENVMNQSAGRTLEHCLLDMKTNASAPGICTARGPEKLMLPENCSKMLSLHDNISLPHAGSSGNPFVPDNVNANVPNPKNSSSKNMCNDHGLPPPEHENKSNPDQSELEEPVRELDAAVGSHLQSETGQPVDQEEKDGSDYDHGNIGLEADDNLVSITKENSRKRSNASWNDQLLEKDVSFVEKKKHKKGKYNPSKESIEDLVANFGSCGHNNETSTLQNVHPQTNTPHHDSSKDLTKDEKKKKKKRKKGESQFDKDIASSIPEYGPSDSLLNNADAAVSLEQRVTEESPQEAFINNHRKVDKESDTALFMDNVARNMTDGDSIEVGDTNPLSTKLKGSNCNTETLLKIRLSSDGSSKDYPIQELFTVVDPQGALGDNPTDLTKESDGAVPLQETATVRNIAEVDSDVPIKPRRTKKSKNESSRTASNKYNLLNSSEDHVNEENLEVSGNNNKDLNKESNFMTAIGEVVDHRNSAEGDSEVPSNTNLKVSHRSRRKKLDKTGLFNPISSTYEPIHSSGYQITEENPKETSGDHYTDPDEEPKGTTVIGDVAILGNPAVEDYSSQPNDRNSHRRRKKSAKAELPNDDSIDKELVHSETIEENPKTLVDDEQGKESKFATILGETVVLGNTVVEDSKAPSSDRNSRHKRKKSAKAELPNHDLIDKDPVHSLVKEASEEKSKEILEDNHKEQGKESKLARVLGEGATCGNPSVEASTVSSNHNDRISRRRKKKSTHDFNDKEPIDSLVKKDTEENLKETLEDGLKEQGKDSKSANHIGEAAACESPVEVNLPIPVYTNDRSSRGRKRKKAKTESKYILDHSSVNQCPEENFEKALGTTHIVSGNESNAGTNPAENAQSLVHGNSSDVNPTVLPHDSSNRHNIANSSRKKVSGEHTEVTHENSEEETFQNEAQKRVAEPTGTNDQMEPPESDSNKVNFIEFFVPKVTQLEPHMSAQELSSLEAETKKSDREKIKRKKKSNIHSEDTTNDMVNSSMLKDVPSKHVKGNISAISDNNLKPILYHEANNILDFADENQQRRNLDAFMGSNPETKSVTHSSACADAIIKETMADLAASSDSTEEDTLSRQYRVAIRKVPSSRYRNNLDDTNKEKIMFSTPGTIFNDTLSGSSEDEFEREKIKATSKILSDNSSTSADSDRGHGQSHTVTSSKPHTYMNFPGVESAYGENDEGTDGIMLTQKSEVKKTKLLSKILRSTSSYRKAKLTASQSQTEDSESQPVDVVLESQPDSALP